MSQIVFSDAELFTNPTVQFLSLTLLQLGIFLVDDINLTLSPHNFAISGTFLDRRSDFHGTLFYRSAAG